ncbi:hypothetical protein CRE_07855 [Caenorhabditis remanei]|uniref:TAR DNA-binding protein 43 N-terminal domain-containing protein n=1 Tax=Caenorhabditis remanei TaxID=31234 RepID=E3NII1_CAERE|nr:hypothetical protein CRE_07855 [Caenorhabditis remanei]
MAKTIKIRMMDNTIELDLPCNQLTQSTIKSQFLLDRDAIVSMSYESNGSKKGCLMNENGTAFILPDGWPDIDFFVESNKTPSRPCSSWSFEGAPDPKKRKIEPEYQEMPVDGDLAASIGRYALYYNKDNYKRSAIPLTPRLAATFRHGENKTFKIGDQLVIRSWSDKTLEVTAQVAKIIEELDTIILESLGLDFCDKDLISNSVLPRKGMQYLMMGFSIIHQNTSHQSLSTGIIVGDVTRRLRYTGSSGSGDSGGSCWNERGQLIGMQIEDQNGRSTSSGGRCCLVAMISILSHIQNLLPTVDSDGESEWNE